MKYLLLFNLSCHNIRQGFRYTHQFAKNIFLVVRSQKIQSTSGFAACGLFSFYRFFGKYILSSLLKWASALLKIVRFHAKNAFIRTLPYVLAYLLNMIRLFPKRLLPMPHLNLLPLHPQRTAWNYSPDGHIHWRLWRSRCDRAIPESVSSVRRLRAAAMRSCV